MTNSKWLRRALLGGVALGVATTGAQAEDLSALKAQLEALQNRVNELETTPAAPSALPDGASLITLKRGQGSLSDWNVDRKSEGRLPQDTGFTIAVTPTADVPAPVTEVTVSGYVKGDVIYDFDQDNLGDSFNGGTGIDNSEQNVSGVRLHARQTRFRIRSRTDTAVGQLRTLIEGHFFGGGSTFALRHAWGEWDMTPNWTLGVGRFWRISCDVFTSVTTIDFGGSAGACTGSRAAQVRFTHTNGPISWRFGISDPRSDREGPVEGSSLSPDFPSFESGILYEAPGGHQLFVGGIVEHIDYEGDGSGNRGFGDDDLGWQVQGGANINLGDIATFTGHMVYSDGLTGVGGVGVDHGHGIQLGYERNEDGSLAEDDDGNPVVSSAQIDTHKTWGGYAGLSFNVTDTTQFNVQYGHGNPSGDTAGFRHVNTIHANIIWSPVRQMRLGWEVVYGWRENTTETANLPGRKRTEDAVRGQFAAWFFF
jgi:hypothetical protein